MAGNTRIMNKAEHKKRIRKLMIHAVNETVRDGVIPLMFRYRRMTKEVYAKLTVCGRLTLINWSDTGHNEFRVSVWWDYRPELLPTQSRDNSASLSLLFPDVNRDRFRFVVGACAYFIILSLISYFHQC